MMGKKHQSEIPTERKEELRKLKASVNSNMAMCYSKKEPAELHKAIASFTASIEHEPSVKGYFKRGQAHLVKGDLDAAKEDFDMATKLDLDKSSSKAIEAELTKLGRLELQQKQKEKKRYAGFFSKLAAEEDGPAKKSPNATDGETVAM